MANRIRKNQIIVRLSDREKELFEKKLELSNTKNMSLFIRKCVLEKNIYVVDMSPFRDLQYLLSNISNNINQISRKCNIEQEVEKKDIREIKKELSEFSYSLILMQRFFNNLKKGGKESGIHYNSPNKINT